MTSLRTCQLMFRVARRHCCFSTTALQVSRHQRTGLIFGANTDVGKTVVAAGLVRASLAAQKDDQSTRYLKPLQSGGSDEQFVRRYNPRLSDAATLFEFDAPISPHLASRLEGKPVSDGDVLDAVTRYLASATKNHGLVTWVETAGGVLSPAGSAPSNRRPQHATNADGWGWIPQADLYQPLLGQVQVVLVGDGRLGGISSTLAALEALLIRGYDVAATVVVDGAVTVEALHEYLSRPVVALRTGSGEAVQPRLVALPPLPPPEETLDDWYEATHKDYASLDRYLDHAWQGQVADLESLATVGSRVLWWPFTQHQTLDRVTLVDSAWGDAFSVLEAGRGGGGDSDGSAPPPPLQRRELVDGCASWWTQGLGHGDVSLALAGAAAAGRYGHVIFPETCHAPAVALAQTLVAGPGRGWAERAFFSDDGSTAMEVAIKMGMKLYQNRMGVTKERAYEVDWVVCAQEDCYHGDTLGVMNVAEPSIFNEGQHPWYEPKGLFLQTPTLGFRDGVLTLSLPEGFEPSFEYKHQFDAVEQVMDVPARMLTSLFSHYKEIVEMQWLVHEHSGVNRVIGSVAIEPILMGAGGMKFVDPLWQRALIEIAKSRSVPVIFDEIASGLYRVGVQSCRDILRADPDIACYAKLLTGGLLPLGVTLASGEVFDSFLGDEKGQALLHGHSYTAYPVGCVAAIQSLEALDSFHRDSKGIQTLFDFEQVREISRLPLVEMAFALGSVLAVTMKPVGGLSGYGASLRTVPIVQKLRQQGIYARPLGNVVYLMLSPLTSREECYRLAGILHRAIHEYGDELN